MTENEIATIVVDSAYHIHRKLGPGLLESVYGAVLFHSLIQRGLEVQEEVPVCLTYDTLVVPNAFRLDLLVNKIVVVELKSVPELSDLHRKQLLTYLKLSGLRLGLLLNFNEVLMKNGICRMVNNLPE